MRRREFIKVIAGLAAAWPLAAPAQHRQHDDLANVIAGVLWRLTPPEQVAWDYGGIGVITQPRAYVSDASEASETMRSWLRSQNYTRAPDGGLGKVIW